MHYFVQQDTRQCPSREGCTTARYRENGRLRLSGLADIYIIIGRVRPSRRLCVHDPARVLGAPVPLVHAGQIDGDPGLIDGTDD